MDQSERRKVIILGFGHLGRFLFDCLRESPEIDVVALWNRTPAAFDGVVPPTKVLARIEDVFDGRDVDLIVEVAHPCITREYGERLLEVADLLVGSPTALAHGDILDRLMTASSNFGHAVYVAKGALWGAADIRSMSVSGQLQALTVTMSKHPSCFRLHPSLEEKLRSDERVILYDGNVADLCPLAPNNVNTMATAAIAASSLGFGNVRGRLISDPSLFGEHIVEVDVEGRNGFRVVTTRKNPAADKAVTGAATFNAFLTSVRSSHGEKSGIHIV